jgi:putative phosphoribosyl transferase
MRRLVPFKNRKQAATLLADKLHWLKKKQQQQGNTNELSSLTILAIPRGGVITGHTLASIVGGDFDILLSEKIVAPYDFNMTIGAVMHDGSYSLVVKKEQDNALNMPNRYIDEQVSMMVKKMERRVMRFRGNNTYNLNGRTVLLVDDGIATGATMFASTQWARRQNPKELIVAVPVAPRDTVDKLRQTADRVLVLHTPPFYDNVGEFYDDFPEVSDYDVENIMQKYIKSKYFASAFELK